MSNLSPSQFGQNPFLAIGSMLPSAGAGGWFRRRAELRHQYNSGLISQHFSDMSAARDQAYRSDLLDQETTAHKDRSSHSHLQDMTVLDRKAEIAREASKQAYSQTRRLQVLAHKQAMASTPAPPAALWTPGTATKVP